MKHDSLSKLDLLTIGFVVALFVGGVVGVPRLAFGAEKATITVDAGPIDAAYAPASSTVIAPEAAPVAPPAPVLPAGDDVVGIIAKVVQSAKEGNWKLVTALLLMLAMAALNRVRGKVKFLTGDRGGAISVMALSFLGALATALAAEMAFDLKLVWGAFTTALIAAGGYNWFKRVVWPEDQGKKPPELLDSAPPAAPEADVPVASPSEVA